MKSGRRYQRGYSLMLELVLGMSLVLVVLLAIFQLFPVGDRAVSLADRTTTAHLIARRVMNEQLEKPFLEVKPTSGEETVTSHTRRRGHDLSTTFVYDVRVQPAAEPEVKDITVTVQWKSGSAESVKDGYVRLESSKGTQW